MEKIKKFLAKLPKGATPRLFLLAVILAVLPVAITLVQSAVLYFSRAQAVQPVFYLTPSPTDLTNNQETTLTLRLDPKGTKISGASVKLTFPKNLIQVIGTKEDLPLFPGNFFSVDTTGSPLSTVIVKPNYDTNANSTGEIAFTIGVPLGGDINLTSPSSDFELAKIRVKAITSTLNQTANINIDMTTTTIVNPQGTSLSYTVNNAVININKVAPSGVSLSFSPNTASLPPNKTVSVMLDAGSNKIVAARAEVLFNPSLVRLASAPDVSASPLKQVILVSTLSDANTNGRVIIALGAAPSDTPPSGLFELAKLTFTAQTTSATSATLSYDQPKIQIVDENATNLSFTTSGATLQLNGGTTATPTTPPTTGGGYIKLVPQQSTVLIGDILPVDIRFRTAIVNQTPTAISSIALRLTYPYSGTAPVADLVDSSGNPAVEIQPSSELLATGSWSYQINQITRSNGIVTVDLAIVDTSTTGFAGSTELSLGTIRLLASQVPTPNPLTVTFDTTETVMLTKNDPVANLLDPLVNGVYTFAEPGPKFTFSFKMQGVTKGGVEREVDLTLSNNVTTKTYKVTVVSDNLGVFRPASPFTLTGLPADPGGTTYDVYVKGLGYLRKLLGSMLFSDSGNHAAPTSWSSKIVPAGDFDDNNILNIYDIAILLSHYTLISVPSTHPDYDKMFDLNADNQINGLDIATVLNNYIALSVPGD